MCGILGLFGGTRAEASALERHIGSLAHRGPDGQNVASGEGWAFGHALLSIIGVSPITQPYRTRDGGLVLTYNGEIYNYVELLEEDAELRGRCSGRSDTEVLAEGLGLHGIRFVEKLNGIFAFAAFDLRTGEGFLVRDRLGVKPLYLAIRGEDTYFGSEIRALQAFAGLPDEPDPEGFYSYARFRYPLGERTYKKGVGMLPPGSIMRIAGQTRRIERYWDIPEPTPFKGSYEEARERVRELLLDTMRLQMRSDHSFCTYLSGGLDSSLLTAIARANKPELDTYSIGLRSAAHDETAQSTEVARLMGTNHHPYLLGPAEYREQHAEFVRHLGAPISLPNQVALKVLSRELGRDHRCVLSGEGADEVFGGYGKIFLLPADWERAQPGGGHAEGPEFRARLEARYGREALADYPALFLSRYAYVSHERALEWLGRYFPARDLEAARGAVEGEIRDWFSKWSCDLYSRQLLLFQKIHVPGLLIRLDVATMAHSVEGRVPFLDHRLVEFANSLPMEYKMRRLDTFDQAYRAGLTSDELSEVHDVPKTLLKDIARPVLPESIVWRKKMGFPIPVEYYAPAGGSDQGSPYEAWVRKNLELVAGEPAVV